MLYQASLVCEGGAMAGVYTADVLTEHDIYFSHVIGVSIGSCNAIDFASGQIGRTIDRSLIYTEVVATDCETGEPLYIPCKTEDKQVMRASRASSSMPFLSKIYEFEGRKCLTARKQL